jgi:hypothetical protein
LPFCPNCGIPVEASQRFCPSCGTKLGPVPTPPPQVTQTNAPAASVPILTSVPQVPVAPVLASSILNERIVAIVPNLKKPKSFGRWDTYNLIVTERRCIFALLTSDMLNRAIKEANEQGKSQGKGFMDRWGDQLQASMGYWKQYESIEPEKALRENKENFSVDLSAVKSAYVNRKEKDGQGRNAIKIHYWEVVIETRSDKFKYESDGDPSSAVARAFGGRT